MYDTIRRNFILMIIKNTRAIYYECNRKNRKFLYFTHIVNITKTAIYIIHKVCLTMST